MKKPKVLFVFQEITPYLPDSHLSNIGRHLPQGIQERGKEIRTFMPRYGCISERRNQLHEVIRLSGMNIIIDDTDHPLIIKVASIQSARMQIYFIDNEDYFQRKAIDCDKSGSFFDDNDERSIFFSRGVLETVKKLGWAPDVIHCHGWMSSAIPYLIKVAYKDNPLFTDTKVVYSVYDDEFPGQLDPKYSSKLLMDGISKSSVDIFREPTYENLTRGAIAHSDGVIIGSENINTEIHGFIATQDIPVLSFQNDDSYIDAYSEFYEEVMVSEEVYSD